MSSRSFGGGSSAARLDAAYRRARGGDWSADMPDARILEQLLALNLDASKP